MKTPKVIYEPEDDVLNIWLSEKNIDDAEDINGVITHYTEDREPVYIEVLNASRFFKDANHKKPKQIIWDEEKISTSVAHRVR